MRAGIDSQKRTLAVAVVDDTGRQQQVQQFANDPKGHLRLGKGRADQGVTRVGIEGSGHLGRAAAAWLVEVGFDVRVVPCGFTVRELRRRAGAGKSDPIDTLAIARVTAREEDLVPARGTGAGVKIERGTTISRCRLLWESWVSERGRLSFARRPSGRRRWLLAGLRGRRQSSSQGW